MGGQKTNRAPQLSAVPPLPQAPGIAANSREAFASDDLGRCQRQVLDAITELWRQGWRPSDQDIAAYLGWPINCITPRRDELVDAGRVIKGGDKRGETGRRVSWWRPAQAAAQAELFPS